MAWDDRLIPGEMPFTAKIMIAGMEITPKEIERLRRIEAAAREHVNHPRGQPIGVESIGKLAKALGVEY